MAPLTTVVHTVYPTVVIAVAIEVGAVDDIVTPGRLTVPRLVSDAIVDGYSPFSALYISAISITALALLTIWVLFALFVTPEYDTIEIAARMPMTTITTKSSTMVNPRAFLVLIDFFIIVFAP